MTIVKALLFYQLIIISSNANDKITKFKNGYEELEDTFETYSKLSAVLKVTEVTKGLSKVHWTLDAITAPVGAIAAYVEIEVGNIE